MAAPTARLPNEPPAEVSSLRMTVNSLLVHYRQRFGEDELRNLICTVLDTAAAENCQWCGRPFDRIEPVVDVPTDPGTPSAVRRTYQ